MLEIDGPASGGLFGKDGTYYPYTVYALSARTVEGCQQAYAVWRRGLPQEDFILVWRTRPDLRFYENIHEWVIYCRCLLLPIDRNFPHSLQQKEEGEKIASITSPIELDSSPP